MAFVIALTTGGLWVKTHTYVTQPSVRFKYDALLVFETSSPGQEKVWSTFESVNALAGNKLAAVDIQASERDLNFDGRVDVIDVKAVARGVGNVHGVKALMAFDYDLGGKERGAGNSQPLATRATGSHFNILEKIGKEAKKNKLSKKNNKLKRKTIPASARWIFFCFIPYSTGVSTWS